jgi:MOSC domain-containing protein YiiM
MKLTSINIGQERAIDNDKPFGKTGIFKRPVSGPVRITSLGIPEDVVMDKKHHGGPDQAVYVYGSTDYDYWSKELGRQVLPGTFGENLTIEGLESARISIGDRLHIGELTLQVTSPRIPCKTLAVVMGDPDFIKRFREAARPGIYCRVLQEGQVQAGDPVRLEPFEAATVTNLEMFLDYYQHDSTEAEIQRYLAAPISVRSRIDKEKQLQGLRGK